MDIDVLQTGFYRRLLDLPTPPREGQRWTGSRAGVLPKGGFFPDCSY